MNRKSRLAAAALMLGAASPEAALSRKAIAQEAMTDSTQSDRLDHAYLGMWVTEDGRIRQELLPNGRYDEARGNRKSAYQGRYVVTGDHIDYWDDTGFTADGEFIDGVLHHGGMIFYRER